MRHYVLKRLALGIFTVWGVATLVFFLGRALPGDPIDVMLGESASAQDREALTHALHLDLPPHVQYLRFLGGLIRMDLGVSLRTGTPVAQELGRAFPLTVVLGGTALGFALLLSLPLGIVTARFPGSYSDRAARLASTAGLALPSFLLGPVFILFFAVFLPFFPVSGSDEPWAVVLPAVTLAIPLASILNRMVRASVLEEAGKDYVRTARAKGLSEFRCFFIHVLRNALLPVLTLVGMQFGAVLTGAIITEKIFRWPGLGTLILTSIGSRDYPVVQSGVLLFAVVYVTANLLTDLAYGIADPRVSYD